MSVRHGASVTDAVYDSDTATWSVVSSAAAAAGEDAGYDAVVMATHDRSLAGKVVSANCTTSNLQGSTDNTGSELVDGEEPVTPDLDVVTRKFAAALTELRTTAKAPVFTLTVAWAAPLGLPFDAVTCPASPHLQFLVREQSKPGRTQQPQSQSDSEPGEEVWVAVSTSAYAQELLSMPAEQQKEAATHLQAHLMDLLAQYDVPPPATARAKRWGAGFSAHTLGLQENCVSFEQWKIAVCGDYFSDHATPIEAAVLSGLEAAYRVTMFLEEEHMHQ